MAAFASFVGELINTLSPSRLLRNFQTPLPRATLHQQVLSLCATCQIFFELLLPSRFSLALSFLSLRALLFRGGCPARGFGLRKLCLATCQIFFKLLFPGRFRLALSFLGSHTFLFRGSRPARGFGLRSCCLSTRLSFF